MILKICIMHNYQFGVRVLKTRAYTGAFSPISVMAEKQPLKLPPAKMFLAGLLKPLQRHWSLVGRVVIDNDHFHAAKQG
jgi:hypothetical protein